MKRFAALLALAAAPAFAQTPPATTPDPLCAGLTAALAAAAEPRPFISLMPPGQTTAMLPALQKPPAGFESFKGCEIYRAGNAVDGVIGGGQYNALRCTALQIFSFNAPEGAAQAAAAHTALAARAGACLAPAGWTASALEGVRKYEDRETSVTWTLPGSPNDVIAWFLTDNSSPSARSPSTTWTVQLQVRNPNPGWRKPE